MWQFALRRDLFSGACMSYLRQCKIASGVQVAVQFLHSTQSLLYLETSSQVQCHTESLPCPTPYLLHAASPVTRAEPASCSQIEYREHHACTAQLTLYPRPVKTPWCKSPPSAACTKWSLLCNVHRHAAQHVGHGIATQRHAHRASAVVHGCIQQAASFVLTGRGCSTPPTTTVPRAQ